MPLANWQRQRNALRPERRRFSSVGPCVPCAGCGHPRSSHSMVTMYGRCRGGGCSCLAFDPACGCGHLLSAHAFGTPPDHWACAQCICKGFGALQTAEALGRLF